MGWIWCWNPINDIDLEWGITPKISPSGCVVVFSIITTVKIRCNHCVTFFTNVNPIQITFRRRKNFTWKIKAKIVTKLALRSNTKTTMKAMEDNKVKIAGCLQRSEFVHPAQVYSNAFVALVQHQQKKLQKRKCLFINILLHPHPLQNSENSKKSFIHWCRRGTFNLYTLFYDCNFVDWQSVMSRLHINLCIFIILYLNWLVLVYCTGYTAWMLIDD